MSDSNLDKTSTVAAPEGVAAPERKVSRKTRVGVVVSDKMTKTIVVNVERRVPHSQFGKIVRRSSRFYAHDEEGLAKEGDKVLIEETIPKSKLKCWRLVEVLAH